MDGFRFSGDIWLVAGWMSQSSLGPEWSRLVDE